MQSDRRQIIVSATDLVGYLACDHLATLELERRRAGASGRLVAPIRRCSSCRTAATRTRPRTSPGSARRGGVVEIPKDDLKGPAGSCAPPAATFAAMRSGVDVIFQATFFDGRWRGHADFLYRVERPTPVLGAYGYDIADTKLSRGVKASAIVQMCVYADLLEKSRARAGDRVRRHRRWRRAPPPADDYAAYFRFARARFEQRVLGGSAASATYPDPVDFCQVCAWYPTCIQRRRDDDHPSIVAGMRRVDTERFVAAGIPR